MVIPVASGLPYTRQMTTITHMTRVIHIQDLSPATRELLGRMAPGDELVIEEGGQPVAKITPVAANDAAARGPRKLGLLAGSVDIAPDFDEELPAEFWNPPGDPLTK
jgi:antitoxin (DNA-binding transcriptional repressor) of toxin-antitoxin stability system